MSCSSLNARMDSKIGTLYRRVMERGALQQIQEKVRQTLAYLRGGTCETKITSSFSLSLLVTSHKANSTLHLLSQLSKTHSDYSDWADRTKLIQALGANTDTTRSCRAASYQANACWSSNNREIGYVGLEEIKELQLLEMWLCESMLRNRSMAITSMARHPAAAEIGDTLSCLAFGPNALYEPWSHERMVPWFCNLRLERVLHDEDKGIGFSRGLSPDGCQTFEMFLPPDTAVQLSNGHVAARVALEPTS